VTLTPELTERRNQLEGWLAGGYREADKIIVSVSSGVLAFSAAFVRDIGNMKGHGAVSLAYLLLVLAIAIVVLSINVEHWDLSSRINKINSKKPEGGFTWRNWTIAVLNVLSSVTFLTGIICIAWFLMSNVQ
jgi:hypothetical protein